MPNFVRKRFFTISEANALLPRVRPHVLRMMQLRACLRSDDEGNPVSTPPGTPWLADPVLAAWNAQDHKKTDTLAAAVEATLRSEQAALSALGVHVKDLSIGMLDFPSFLDGESEVALCWRVSEPEIRFFHAPKKGYRGRRSVEGHTFSAEQNPSGELSG
jgi:hypothetical protein